MLLWIFDQEEVECEPIRASFHPLRCRGFLRQLMWFSYGSGADERNVDTGGRRKESMDDTAQLDRENHGFGGRDPQTNDGEQLSGGGLPKNGDRNPDRKTQSYLDAG